MALEIQNFLVGFYVFVFVVISLIVGIKIALKYFKFKHSILIYVGVGWMGMAFPWLPDTIVFLVFLFNVPVKVWYINAAWYLILGTGFLPFFLTFWLISLKKVIYVNKGIYLVIGNIIIGILYEIYLCYFLFTDISQLITFENIYEARFGLIMKIYIIFSIVLIIITGLHFGITALKTNNPESKLKGIFLVIAFITFIVGSILDTGLIIIVRGDIGITKFILMSSSIEFYIGYILPEWVKKRFLKQNQASPQL